MELELDLKQYFHIIRKRIWWIVAVTLLAALASGLISFFVLKPVYQSNTMLYVGKKLNMQSNLAYNEVMLGSQLVKDYRELVKSRLVSSMVIEKLNLGDVTVDEIAAMLSVNYKNDTRLIEITARNGDQKLAQDIANTVAEVFQQKVMEVMNAENVQIIDVALYPQKPSKPNKMMNIAIATLMGMMAGLGLVFLLEYLDQTIKTPQDVQRHVELPVLGTIPDFTA